MMQMVPASRDRSAVGSPPTSRRTFLAGLVPAALALGAAGRASPPGPPLFRLVPNPPSAGKDLEVTYLGDSPESVVFQVGTGDVQKPVIGSDGRFTIPKRLLRGGRRLFLSDGSIGVKGDLSVLIEP